MATPTVLDASTALVDLASLRGHAGTLVEMLRRAYDVQVAAEQLADTAALHSGDGYANAPGEEYDRLRGACGALRGALGQIDSSALLKAEAAARDLEAAVSELLASRLHAVEADELRE